MAKFNVTYQASAGIERFLQDADDEYRRAQTSKTEKTAVHAHELGLRNALLSESPSFIQETLREWRGADNLDGELDGEVPATAATHGGHGARAWQSIEGGEVPDDWRDRIATFRHILDAIRQFCRPRNEDIQCEQRLSALRQTGDVQTYYNAFIKAARDSGYTLNEKGTIKLFKEALSSTIHPKVRREGMTSLKVKMMNITRPTLSEVCDAALEYEADLIGVATANGLSSYHGPTSPEAAILQQAAVGVGAEEDDAHALRRFKDEIISDIVKGHIEPLGKKVDEQAASTAAILATLQKMDSKIDDLSQSRRRNPGPIRCYNCNKTGHMARECPEPDRRKAKEEGQD